MIPDLNSQVEYLNEHGGTLTLEPIEYFINRPLTIDPKNKNIKTVICGSNATIKLAENFNGNHVIYIPKFNTNIVIEDLIIYGPYVTGVYAYHLNRPTSLLRNIKVIGASTGFVLVGCQFTRFFGLWADNCQFGFDILDSNASLFIFCRATGCSDAMTIKSVNNPCAVTIGHCNFEGNRRGIFIEEREKDFKEIVIKDSWFERNGTYAIRYKSSGVILRDNRIGINERIET